MPIALLMGAFAQYIADRLRRLVTIERGEPWAFPPLRERSRAYQIINVLMLTVIPPLATWSVWNAPNITMGWGSTWFAIATLLTVFVISIKNFRWSDSVEDSPAAYFPDLLVFAAMPYLGAACSIVAITAQRLKRRLVLHLVLLNVLVLGYSRTCFMAAVFFRVLDGAPLLSGTGFVASLATIAVGQLVDAAVLDLPLVAFKTESARSVLAMRWEFIRYVFLTVGILDIAVAGAMTEGKGAWHLLAFAPLLVNLELSFQVTRLVGVARERDHDVLTGVWNRRAFEREVTLMQIAPSHVVDRDWLLMCDLDHFKNINDTWGHDVGDQALQRVAELLSASVRDSDVVARIGGEEFALLIRKCSMREVDEIAERLRADCENVLRKWGSSVSIGVTAIDPICGYSEWLRRADGALYQAKDSGRNRVIHAEDDPQVAA